MTRWEIAALERLNHDRDPAILLALAEAGVLTTGQLCRLHFSSLSACQRRLRVLRGLRLIEGFRPGLSRRVEICWGLADRGAHLLTTILGEPVRAGAWGRGEVPTRSLPHRQAVTEFFMALVPGNGRQLIPVRAGGYHRIRPALLGEPATLWLGERSCRQIFGDPASRPYGARAAIVPDGAALVGAAEATQAIVLELDRGTEALHVLADKLRRYARVGGITVVLCCTDPARATWRPPDPGVDVVVGALAAHLADPWGRVWVGRDGARRALGESLLRAR